MFSRIYLEITNCCNLSCAFCPGTRRARRMLPAEEFRLLAGKLRPWTDYLYLHVLGEPLLHPQLAEILASAGELGFRVCLVTNGTLLAQRLDTLLAAPALHKLSVSLHSFEANDAPMPLETYLAAVWDGCARLAERGVLCALRLWNEGGWLRRTRRSSAIWSGAADGASRTSPPTGAGTAPCGQTCF